MGRKVFVVFGILAVGFALGLTATQSTTLAMVSDQEALAVGGGAAHVPCGNATIDMSSCNGSNLCAWPPGWYSCPSFTSNFTYSSPGDRVDNADVDCVNRCGNCCGLMFTTHNCP